MLARMVLRVNDVKIRRQD